ncbi:MAG TPA: hypothetical protein VKA60_13255 [Blastocatellia bacterium]|nr:hypothetical protein [Blastocatellia bacterium]
MPAKADSRFMGLPILRVHAPDGVVRQVIALRLQRPPVSGDVTTYQVKDGEPIDLLAQRFYGDDGLWWRILDANPLVYPLDIGKDRVLKMPARGPATRVTRARSF